MLGGLLVADTDKGKRRGNQQRVEADASFNDAEQPHRIRRAGDPSLGAMRAPRQTGHERREHRGRRLHRVPEHEAELTEPEKLINQRGETRKKHQREQHAIGGNGRSGQTRLSLLSPFVPLSSFVRLHAGLMKHRSLGGTMDRNVDSDPPGLRLDISHAARNARTV
ncbi:MAG: hypothetical protein FJ388_14860 [Verrucomicrobia bacterium]|nr:hypothetical protein [Verrucomicrobiota bacterium]